VQGHKKANRVGGLGAKKRTEGGFKLSGPKISRQARTLKHCSMRTFRGKKKTSRWGGAENSFQPQDEERPIMQESKISNTSKSDPRQHRPRAAQKTNGTREKSGRFFPARESEVFAIRVTNSGQRSPNTLGAGDEPEGKKKKNQGIFLRDRAVNAEYSGGETPPKNKKGTVRGKKERP